MSFSLLEVPKLDMNLINQTCKEIIDESESTKSDSTVCSYYDIPEPENISTIEQHICKYLELHKVHMSHPAEREFKKLRPHSSSKNSLTSKKSSFLEKRLKKFSQSTRALLPMERDETAAK